MRKDIKQELLERITSLELALIILLNSLHRCSEIEVSGIQYKLIESLTKKEIEAIEKLVTRPNISSSN